MSRAQIESSPSDLTTVGTRVRLTLSFLKKKIVAWFSSRVAEKMSAEMGAVRWAKSMIEDAEANGTLKPGMTVVEYTRYPACCPARSIATDSAAAVVCGFLLRVVSDAAASALR